MADESKPKNVAEKHDVAEQNYKRTFGTSKQLEAMEEEAAENSEVNEKESDKSGSDKSTKQSAKGIKKLEEQAAEGHWKTADVGKKEKFGKPTNRTIVGMVRHGSAYAFLIGLVALGLWFSSVFAPNIILVNLKEMFTNDLADATVALYTYNNKMLDNKIGKADCSDKESIKCKLSTMSRSDVKRLERAGFTVQGDKVTEDNLDDNDPTNDKAESRYKVTSITFPHNGGTATSADDFEKNAEKSSALKALTYSAFNPKSSFFMDERFKDRIKWRYDLTKAPDISGATEKAVDTSFDNAMQGSSENMDDTGGGNYSLKGLAGSVGTNGLQKTSERVAGLAYSYVANQCAYYTQAKVAYNAMKKAKTTTVARFAMAYLKAADQIKSGLADDVTANALSSKMAWTTNGAYYGGRNATDYSVYRNIVFGESARNESGWMNTLDTIDSVGAMLPPWLITVFITETAVKSIAHISDGDLLQPGSDVSTDGPRKFCLEGQKDSNKATNKWNSPPDCPNLALLGTPAVFPGAMAVAAVGAALSIAPTTGCPPPPPLHDPPGVYRMEPSSIPTVKGVMPYINQAFTTAVQTWANTNANNFNHDTKGTSASEAMFAGTGEILGDMAMSRGMRPGDAQSMQQYLSKAPAINKQIEEVARYDARQTPFDIYNQYSFMGSLVRSFGTVYSDKTPILSTLGSLFSLIPSSIQHLGFNQSASAFFYIQPRTFDSSRLTCSDTGYQAIGIKADVACNVRYSMSQNDLDANVKDVLDYMLKSHSDLTQSNVQELQDRLNVTDNGADHLDKQDVQRQHDEANDVSSQPEIDSKTGKAIANSEYDKFLRYCVNRQDPWGRTGMDVRRKELTDDEKKKRLKDKDQNGIPISTTNDSGDPNELPITDAYMSVYEGAKADQDWYTGKKCLEENDELHNFRAYTMMCSVDGTHSGAQDCTQKDNVNYYFDGFYNNNNIIYTSWW